MADLVFLPRLLVARDSDGLRIAWEEEWAEAVLESALSLSSPWAPVANAPAIFDREMVIYAPSTNMGGFYRLRVF